MNDLDQITAGFIPLLDSAILVTAGEKGFARDEGIDLTLVRETSWANIRDRMAVGHFDVAHMLAPMPIAANLGLTPLRSPVVAPMALGLGGNAVTVSNFLWHEMARQGAGDAADPMAAGLALKKVIEDRSRTGHGALRFAVVHPYSVHNFELRYWLAACGVNPERDVDVTIVPPPLMADALGEGRIDGFCVGEPWNSVAVAAGTGRIATVKAAIWKSSPEKVLAVRTAFAEEHALRLERLLRALYRSAVWCGAPENRVELAAMLSHPRYLGTQAGLIESALAGQIRLGGEETAEFADFFIPCERAATFPWQSHALWCYSQMVRWGQVTHTAANAEAARRTYRPDIYRAALKPLGAPLPGANSKVEGALRTATPVGSARGNLMLGPDGFFDGATFDPEELDGYIKSQKMELHREG